MSTLTLADGTELEVLESSNLSELKVPVTVSGLGHVLTLINDENINGADLAGTTLENKVYTGFHGAPVTDDSNMVVSFMLRDKTELELMKEMLEKQDAQAMYTATETDTLLED